MTIFLTIRLNLELKNSFYQLCKEKKIPVIEAVRLFSLELEKKKELPFFMNKKSNFSHENLVRISIKASEKTKMILSNISKEYGVNTNITIRKFMEYCVTYKKFPF